jgi:hypothetical protein
MFKRVLLTSAAVVLAGTAAIAAPSGVILKRLDNGGLLGINLNAMHSMPNRAPLHTPSKPDFSNLDLTYPNGTYIPWEAYILCGASTPTCNNGPASQWAMGFSGATKAAGIDVALELVSGTGGVTIALYNDSGFGYPGTAIASTVQHVTVSQSWGTMGPTVNTTFSPVKLNASNTYWVVVTPDTDSGIAWDLEDTDFVSSYLVAIQSGTGSWGTGEFSGFVPAAEVIK